MPDQTRAVSMPGTAPPPPMESEIQQLSQMRDRMRMLLSTHLSTLSHQTLTAFVGDVLIRQGSPAERVLLVQTGELTVERCEEGGTPQEIARIGPGELVGEMALVGDQHHSATITVSRGPAEVLVVQSNDLLQAAIYDSDLVMELLALSSNRCRQTNRQLALILEALQALEQQHISTLERCCNDLESGFDPVLSSAAKRMVRLAQSSNRP